MTITVQYVKMPTSETMTEFVLDKLYDLANKFEWVIKADVHFKTEKDTKGKGNICEIELSLPGPRIFASSNEKNYELAVKHTISDLIKQLKKRKATFIKH